MFPNIFLKFQHCKAHSELTEMLKHSEFAELRAGLKKFLIANMGTYQEINERFFEVCTVYH